MCPKIFLLASLCPKGSGIHTTPFLGENENFLKIDFNIRARLSVYLYSLMSLPLPPPPCYCEWCINVYISDSAQYGPAKYTAYIYSIQWNGCFLCTKLGTNSFRLKLHTMYTFPANAHIATQICKIEALSLLIYLQLKY
jgi:hypothetical protein